MSLGTVQELVSGASHSVRRRVLVLVGLVLLCLAAALVLTVTTPEDAGGGEADAAWRMVGLAALLNAVAMADAFTDRARREIGRGRLAWASLGAAGVLLSGPIALLLLWPEWSLAVVDGAFFASSPFFGIGVLLLPGPGRMDRVDRWRVVADAVAAALGVAVASLALLTLGQGGWPALATFEPEMWFEAGSLTIAVFVLAFAVGRQRRPGGIPARQMLLVQVAAATILTASVIAVRVESGIGLAAPAVAGILMILGNAIAVTPSLLPAVEPEGPSLLRWRDFLAEFFPFVPMAAGLLTIVWFATQPVPLPYVLGTAMGLLVVGLVVAFAVARTLSWQAARRLRDQAVRRSFEQTTQDVWFQALVAGTDDVVCVLDLAGRVVYQSPSARTRLGWNAESGRGRDLDERLSDGRDELREAMALASRERTTSFRVPVGLAGGDAAGSPYEAEVRALSGTTGLYGYVVTLHDVSERHQLTAALRRQEFVDSLTGLPNRAGFLQACESQLTADRTDGTAIVAFDIARFGLVNDTRGHHVGDDLLRQIADVLTAGGPGALGAVGRVGGDEFAFVVHGQGGVAIDREVERSASRLIATLGSLGLRLDPDLPVSCHVGYAVSGDDAVRPVELLRRAEVAVEEARALGTGDPVPFDGDAHARRIADAVLETELRRGLAAGQLVLHYQPVVDLGRGTPVGVEALVRWNHPTRGLLSPDAFVPAAERSGLIHQLGEQVLRQALDDLPRLLAASGRSTLDVAVNVSAQQVTATLAPDVLRALTTARAAAGCLVVEVTESAIFARPVEARPALEGLRSHGVRVALDDFGTGYSSLALLTRVPVDILKVDRSFTSRIEAGGEELALVRSILQLSQSLGLTTTAEGVETQAQADLLRAMGCQHAQGYLFARPLPLSEVEAWLRAHRMR